MWVMLRKLLRSYLLLCLISLFWIENPWFQRLILLGWIFHLLRISTHAQNTGVRLISFMGLLCLSQLPGILLIFISAWFARFGQLSEWPSGLMEIWYHPFIYVLEMLPPGHLGKWSDMYLATSLVPLGIVALCSVFWVTTRNKNFRLS